MTDGLCLCEKCSQKIKLSRPRGQPRNTPRKFSRLPQIRISLNIREIRIRFSQQRSGFFHFPIGRSTFRAKIKHAATFGGLKIRSVFHKRQSPEARRVCRKKHVWILKKVFTLQFQYFCDFSRIQEFSESGTRESSKRLKSGSSAALG